MHEYGITSEIARVVLEHARKTGRKPGKITIRLGKLSTYTEESIRFYFDLLKKENHLLEKASLEIIEEPGVIKCRNCGHESETGEVLLSACPKCGSPDTEIVSGRSVIIESIEPWQGE